MKLGILKKADHGMSLQVALDRATVSALEITDIMVPYSSIETVSNTLHIPQHDVST